MTAACGTRLEHRARFDCTGATATTIAAAGRRGRHWRPSAQGTGGRGPTTVMSEAGVVGPAIATAACVPRTESERGSLISSRRWSSVGRAMVRRSYGWNLDRRPATANGLRALRLAGSNRRFLINPMRRRANRAGDPGRLHASGVEATFARPSGEHTRPPRVRDTRACSRRIPQRHVALLRSPSGPRRGVRDRRAQPHHWPPQQAGRPERQAISVSRLRQPSRPVLPPRSPGTRRCSAQRR